MRCTVVQDERVPYPSLAMSKTNPSRNPSQPSAPSAGRKKNGRKKNSRRQDAHPVKAPDTGPSRPTLHYRGFDLYAFQQDAIAAVEAGKSVLVAAPTGAGKTLIAEYTIDKALRSGRRLVYTAPIKTLSNQKFRDFSVAYPDQVGIMTGDVTVHPEAPVLIMTTEIFRNSLFERSGQAGQDVRIRGLRRDPLHGRPRSAARSGRRAIIFAPPYIRSSSA